MVDEAEEIAAARGDAQRLRGIIGIQRKRIDAAVAGDLDLLNALVDAQQDLLVRWASVPLTNDTVQPSIA